MTASARSAPSAVIWWWQTMRMRVEPGTTRKRTPRSAQWSTSARAEKPKRASSRPK